MSKHLVKFQEVLSIKNGKNQRAVESPDGIYPIYGSGGIMGYANSYLCHKNTVVIGRKGTINKPIFVDEPFWNVDTAFGLEADTNLLHPKFLYYFCVKFDFEALSTTVTIPSLTKANLLNVEIPLPPLAEQQKIADELDKISDLIAKRKQQLDKLELLVKAKFVEMFGDPVENPMGWETKSINDLCVVIVDCPHSTPKYTNIDTGFMCIRTSIIKKNKILWNNIEYIHEPEFNDRIKRRKPQKGDIVYSREGAILGIAAMINKDCNVALGQRMMLLSCNENICLPAFLTVAMNFASFLNKALEKVTGSASPHINVADIKSFKMIYPPLALQTQFAAYVQSVEKTKSKMEQGLAELEQLYGERMQAYFE